MVSGNVPRNRRYCEELQRKIFDGRFRFAVNKEVGIDDSVINVCKVPRCIELRVTLEQNFEN